MPNSGSDRRHGTATRHRDWRHGCAAIRWHCDPATWRYGESRHGGCAAPRAGGTAARRHHESAAPRRHDCAPRDSMIPDQAVRRPTPRRGGPRLGGTRHRVPVGALAPGGYRESAALPRRDRAGRDPATPKPGGTATRLYGQFDGAGNSAGRHREPVAPRESAALRCRYRARCEPATLRRLDAAVRQLGGIATP